MPKSPQASNLSSAVSRATMAECSICGLLWDTRGFASHKRSCRRKLEEKKRDAEVLRDIEALKLAKQKKKGKGQQGKPNLHQIPSMDISAYASGSNANELGSSFQHVDIPDNLSSISRDAPLIGSESTHGPELDDILTEYHPITHAPFHCQHFHEYGQTEAEQPLPPHSEQPWQPFRSRIDFEFAAFALEASLNKKQTDTLISLVQRAVKGEEEFTLSNHAEMQNIWKNASDILTPWTKHIIPVPYKKQIHEYEVWGRDFWGWALDLLQDKRLRPHWVWEARRLFKWNGEHWVRFYTEPWTGDLMWKIQHNIPDGFPFGFIIYADKTKLSSFGTQKGYPVIARCANLPVHIRNNEGIGGGTVIGWLPIVPENAAEEGKTGFTNFKRVVWHEAFRKFLETFAKYSKTGFTYDFDGLMRKLFPFILILVADYEEQCIMTLLRGVNSKCCCVVCKVPTDKCSDLSKMWPLRTAVESKALVEQAIKMRVDEAEELLKAVSLRKIENAFLECGAF